MRVPPDPPADWIRDRTLEGFRALEGRPCTAYRVRKWIRERYRTWVPSAKVKQAVDVLVTEGRLELVPPAYETPLKFFKVVV